MEKIFEIILENSIILIFFLTLRQRGKFQNEKIAWVTLTQLLLAYNFYVILTQFTIEKTIAIAALVLLFLGMSATLLVIKRQKNIDNR